MRGEEAVGLEAEIFYFSGTGNSLFVAREIAIRLDALEIPVASLMGRVLVRSDADVVGIVFPVYNAVNGGLPAIVRRFISVLQTRYDAYIFAVCTCGVDPGEALPNTARALQSNGMKLSAGFTVKMPSNYPDFTDRAEQVRRLWTWHESLEELCIAVMANKENEAGEPRLLAKGAAFAVGAFQKRAVLKNYRKLALDSSMDFDEAVRHIDQSYEVDRAKCDGCGICADICPVDNVALLDGRPVWMHHCESCLACLIWCPREAVSGGVLSGQAGRYHHPRMKVKDMLRQKNP